MTRIKINTHDDIPEIFDEKLNAPAGEIARELFNVYNADRANQKKFIYCAGTLRVEGLGQVYYVGCFTKADQSVEVWFSRDDKLYQRAMEDARKCEPGDLVGSSGGMVN